MTATHQQAEKVESTEPDVKQRLHAAIDALPEEALSEVASFVEYQRYKLEHGKTGPPYEPTALGGLWKDLGLSPDDLDEARREMRAGFEERDL